MNSQVLRILGEGEHFGDIGLINNCCRTLSVIVTSETAKILSIDKATFNTLYDNIEHHLKKDYRRRRNTTSPYLSSFKSSGIATTKAIVGEFDDVQVKVNSPHDHKEHRH